MKHQTEIANELRAQGRKFSQTKLMSDLINITPAFEHGRVKLYDDEVLDALLALYPVRRKPVVIEPEYVEVDDYQEPEEPQYDRLKNIEMMLQAICKDLNIAIH